MTTKGFAKGFQQHGVDFRETTNAGQGKADCPFCGKPGKFFADVEEGVWDCKVCGRHGNFYSFLEERARSYEKGLRDAAALPLIKSRGLRLKTFLDWGVGYNGEWYSIPARACANNVAHDIKRFIPGKPSRSTINAKLCLMGPKVQPASDIVWLCEGEWDGMAMWEALGFARRAERVLSAPGASNLPQMCWDLFQGKDVRVLYDNDDAGRKGAQRVHGLLKTTAKKMSFLHWPDGLPDGYDVRDLYKQEKVTTVAWIEKHMKPSPPALPGDHADEEAPSIPSDKPTGKGLRPEKVESLFSQHLEINGTDVFAVLFGTIFANRLDAEPLWLFLVAPPGGMKSELLMSLNDAPLIHLTTTLTPQSLISGMNFGQGGDPSLIPKLNEKVLIVKDFTTILKSNPNARDEIFGILRDAYDGEISKTFGNNVTRNYKSRFGIIAGVTPVIESMGSSSVLGERFLKFRITDTDAMGVEHAAKVVERAIRNACQSNCTKRRDALRDAAKQCLDRDISGWNPTINDEMLVKIRQLSHWVANMRGVVDRDKYTGRVNYKPHREISTRLGVQFARLAMGISIYRFEEEVSDDSFRIVARVGRDTAPDRVCAIVRTLYLKEVDTWVAAKDVAAGARLPVATTRHLLEDMQMLKLVERRKVDGGEWRLEGGTRRLTESIDVFSTEVTWKQTKSRRRRG